MPMIVGRVFGWFILFSLLGLPRVAQGILFYSQGVDYTTTAFSSDTNSDLRIWRICGNFPEYAPLYLRTHEIGKPVVVFGRGTQRGSEVIISSGLTNSLKGWFWGPADGVQR